MLTHWIAIIILILLGLSLIKLEHHAKAVKMFIILIIGAILYFSIVSVFSSPQVDLASPKGIVSGAYLYIGWMGEAASNLWDIGIDTTHMVGNAIKVNDTKK